MCGGISDDAPPNVQNARTDLAPGVAVKAEALATSTAHIRVVIVVFILSGAVVDCGSESSQCGAN